MVMQKKHGWLFSYLKNLCFSLTFNFRWSVPQQATFVNFKWTWQPCYVRSNRTCKFFLIKHDHIATTHTQCIATIKCVLLKIF
jgi:hypothetical protein